MSDFVIKNGVLTKYTGNGGDVTIPDSVTKIGSHAFRGCTSLTSVTIPRSMTEVGNSAFRYCNSLTLVTIPDSVTTIEHSAFEGCTSLTSFNVSEQNPNYTSINGVLYDKEVKTLICCPTGKKSVTIPNGVTTIGEFAFDECESLTSVTIPDSVTEIGGYAFCQTPWLAEQQKKNPLVIVNGILIDGTTCSGAVTIPNSVATIGRGAFAYCTSLTSVTIPDSVTTIEEEVFEECESLKELILGKKVYPCDKSVSEEISSILETIQEKKFSELPDNDLAHFFMWGYYKRTLDNSALPYVGDFWEELPPVIDEEKMEAIAEELPSEPQFDDVDSEEKFQALMESAMEEDKPSALPPLEKFPMYLTPQKVKEYLYLCVDKKSHKVSTLLWDYMETDSYILEDYKETENKKFLAHIKEHFQKFMDSAIAQNDIEAVQKFAQEDGLFTAENIDEYLHKCIDKRRNQILMILLDYKENHFPE